MKHIIFFTVVLSLFSAKSFAKISDQFFFNPYLSIEYSAPDLTGGGSNADFKTNNFGKQISGIENFAFGGNFRVHKNLGFNVNWSQSALHNNSLRDVFGLSQEAQFKIDHYNYSALVYAPIDEFFELFAEAGVADVNSKLNYITAAGTSVTRKAHETMGLYGAGLQIKPWEKCDDMIRISFQKYSGKLALLDSNYTTVRIGYLKAF